MCVAFRLPSKLLSWGNVEALRGNELAFKGKYTERFAAASVDKWLDVKMHPFLLLTYLSRYKVRR